MSIRTMDDLRRAQNALKPKHSLPLPFPFDVVVEKPVDKAVFYISRPDFMINSWSYQNCSEKFIIKNPVSGLFVDQLFSDEIAQNNPSLFVGTVPLLRYDFSGKYSYSKLQEYIPYEFIFENETFGQVLAVLLNHGWGYGRTFLRGERHTNLFFVYSQTQDKVLAVSVRWSWKILSDSSFEGWLISTEIVDNSFVFPYGRRLYAYQGSTKALT